MTDASAQPNKGAGQTVWPNLNVLKSKIAQLMGYSVSWLNVNKICTQIFSK